LTFESHLTSEVYLAYPRMYTNLFEVMGITMTGQFVKVFLLHSVLSAQEGYFHCAIEERSTYTSGVLDLFLPLKNSGKALLSIAWTLKRKKNSNKGNH